MHPIELRGPNIRLREYTPADAEQFHAFAAHPRVFEHVRDETPPTVDDVRGWLTQLVAQAQADGPTELLAAQASPPRQRHELAIVEGDRVIGSIGLIVDEDDPTAAELGYVVHPDWWGRGVATEAAGLMIRHGFDDLGLRRIHAGVSGDNPASHRVLEKLGLRRLEAERYEILAAGADAAVRSAARE
jgi:RimJ/RimL family protein N-acetyltransferase